MKEKIVQLLAESGNRKAQAHQQHESQQYHIEPDPSAPCDGLRVPGIGKKLHDHQSNHPTMKSMPSRRAFWYRVFRSMPRARAALDLLPACSWSTRRMCCRSMSSSVVGGVLSGTPLERTSWRSRSTSATPISPDMQKMASRSTRFSSSRTFPGHDAFINRFTAESVIVILRLLLVFDRFRKCCTSSGMSSRRSSNPGRLMTTTLSR